ncbi:MAG: glycosyltransferase family 4 protein [Steroidobacteraceae bacterium]
MQVIGTNDRSPATATEFTVCAARLPSEFMIALMTGCQDRHYAFGLATALAGQGVSVEIIGSDEIDSPEFHTEAHLRFLNFRRGHRSDANFLRKLAKLLGYYARLLVYLVQPGPRIVHILWNYKLDYFDRTILMLFYRIRRRKVVLTAHNVNRGRRDGTDSWLNRLTLKVQYRLCDHIFVHTSKMRNELCEEFGVDASAVTVIPYPINNALPDTDLTPDQAKKRLGLRESEMTMLFFGRIVPYKGIEYLIDAFDILVRQRPANYRLILAGEPMKGAEGYISDIRHSLRKHIGDGTAIVRAEFIPDEDVEIYLKGADVLILPYREIFQSGVLIMAYCFGLPVVATDVGSFRDDVVEGRTGFLCAPGDPSALAAAVETYFASDLYRNLTDRRPELKSYVRQEHSWHTVAALTRDAYAKVLK